MNAANRAEIDKQQKTKRFLHDMQPAGMHRHCDLTCSKHSTADCKPQSQKILIMCNGTLDKTQ
ncbi:hypothetical protein INR49_012569 [Caranx melampygus]|nr:hypothetical protein INR49_012569 [Caranx melampygus]